MGRPEKGLKQSLGAALWQWGRHRELPESADPIFEAAEMVYAALMGDPADLIAAVRSGVESGTIEGEVVEVHQDTFGRSVLVMAGNPMADAADNLKSDQRYLVIPDGGSET